MTSFSTYGVCICKQVYIGTYIVEILTTTDCIIITNKIWINQYNLPLKDKILFKHLINLINLSVTILVIEKTLIIPACFGTEETLVYLRLVYNNSQVISKYFK